jgi:hypothetical protein
MAIKFINYVQNNVLRGETSRLFDLLGVQSAVTFYPFWCRVTSVAPRRKQGELGTGKSYRLVGYSSHHKGGYQLWNEDTDRVVVRGDVHSLTFYPEDTTSHTDTHTQAQDGNASSDTTITYAEEDGIQGRGRPASGPSNGQSLSLSRISHADDSGSHFGVSTQVLTVAVEGWTTIPPLCGRVILTIQCQDQACFEGQLDGRVVESSG